MAERKTNRNAQRLKRGHGFRISRKPVVHVIANDSRHHTNGSIGIPHQDGARVLFAIARDPQTIFASWNIDWQSVFNKRMPPDRQVHVRLYHAHRLEKTVPVEAMAAMHYVTILDPHGSYRLEIGYYQPVDVWNSVAASEEILMPRYEGGEAANADIATIPFHVSFQQLVDLFEPVCDAGLATVIARFQDSASRNEEPNDLDPEQKNTLKKLNLSPSEIATARRTFEQIDGEKLARRTRALLRFGSTSPSRGFEGDWSSAGS
jgi:hypothetical protein